MKKLRKSKGNRPKCSCGAGNQITCPKCSSVKMVFALKNGYNYLKFKDASGIRVNPVWYSHICQNNNTEEFIISGMLRRFQGSQFAGKVNKILFYNNFTKQEIRTITA